jgi:hypothetical protein
LINWQTPKFSKNKLFLAPLITLFVVNLART